VTERQLSKANINLNSSRFFIIGLSLSALLLQQQTVMFFPILSNILPLSLFLASGSLLYRNIILLLDRDIILERNR
jgi:hypothetical protein